MTAEELRQMPTGDLEALLERIERELKERPRLHPINRLSYKKVCRAQGCAEHTRKTYERRVDDKVFVVALCGKHRYIDNVLLKPHMPPETE